MEERFLSRMRLRRWRISACSVTSRLEVGSSAMTNWGSRATPMAIMTRWAIPPLIWNG